MTNKSLLNILFVTESSPLEPVSYGMFNEYIKKITKSISEYGNVAVFFTQFASNEELYSLSIEEINNITFFKAFIPKRYSSFVETFENENMENILKYILKEYGFDIVHILSLKNHSFNYPFIIKKRGIPVVFSVFDNFIQSFHPFSFKNFDKQHEIIPRLSNFIVSPVTNIFNKLSSLFSKTKGRKWFEHIGRYSIFYNKTSNLNTISGIILKRKQLFEDIVKFVDLFHFPSESFYNLFFRQYISESKVFFLEEGVEQESLDSSKPFEIKGPIDFAFIGEIIPEDGIIEMLKAFKNFKKSGFQGRLHIYGEIVENQIFFDKLNKNIPDLLFHGPIDPARLNAVADSFHVLVAPSKWCRTDSYFIKKIISRRKPIITSRNCKLGEIVAENGRGITLSEITPQSIYDAFVEMETNRKRLYYFMRVLDNFNSKTIEENANNFVKHYLSISKNNNDKNNLILSRKLFKRKIERLRGIS
jgi:glycosyltransferase involved in cell wall biosynthesis